MNGWIERLTASLAALTLVSAVGLFGCGGATPEASIEAADAVEVTFYYLPG